VADFYVRTGTVAANDCCTTRTWKNRACPRSSVSPVTRVYEQCHFSSNMTTKPRSTQELPISHKTRKLNQKTENMILTTIAHGGPSKRSLQQNSSVHSASVPAKKRRRTIIKSISIKPSDYVQSAFKANGFAIDAIKKDAEAMFSIPTQEMIEAYKPEILDAVRKNDLQKVKELHKAGILTINGCNKFGESTLHLACRRGYTDIVRYFLDEVKVDVNLRDDYYRTPLHDACWTIAPEFDLVELLMSRAPHQLLMQDVRGFTPFDYVRGEHNGKWLRFLWERKANLRPLDKPNTDDISTAFALASLRK
jgi:hypothetical protein